MSIPSDKKLRAFEADALLKNPMFNEAFRLTEEAIINGMKASDVSDANRLLALTSSLQSLQAVKDCVEGFIQDAEYEATIAKREED